LIAGLRGADAAFRRQAAARLLAALAIGASLNLAFAPFDWWPIGLLAPAALFALLRGLPPRRAAWVGAAFGVGLFAFGTYWLYTCLHVFGLVPLWLTVLLQAVLVTVMAAFVALPCYLANRFWLKASAARDWLVLPALWVLCEWLRGWILTGFPWLSLGYSFIDSPLAGWAPLFGIYGVTLSAVSIAAGLNAACGAQVSMRYRTLCMLAMGAILGLPLLVARHAWTHVVGAPLPVAAVQGAVSQDQKWQIKNRAETMTRYAALTQKAWGARLIVWPESALPVLADTLTDYLADLRREGRAHDAEFAIGLVNYLPATHAFFNGLLVMSNAGDGWYYKRHLVPFGEYFPVPDFLRNLMRLMNLPYDDISAGAARQPILSAAGQNLGLTICYEDAFGSEQLEVLRHATLLVNVTNNAWFGNSTAPHQHLQISRMRALEAERYLLRSTNDGITAAIDQHGKIIARLPQFEEAVLRADLQPRAGLTPYARFGNYPVILTALALLGAALVRRRMGR
jgi:apolipoprotein N-acyltransferase